MKLKISYNNAKDKFYFDYADETLETFYGDYAAIEALIKVFNKRVLAFVDKQALAAIFINEALNNNVTELEV